MTKQINFFDLPDKEQKKIINKAVEDTNRMQREMVNRENCQDWEQEFDERFETLFIQTAGVTYSLPGGAISNSKLVGVGYKVKNFIRQLLAQKARKEGARREKKPICYDFDGVLHEFKNGWDGDVPKGKPIKDAVWAIEWLVNKGEKVVVCTTRANLAEVEKWLEKWGFPEVEVTNKKPQARAYVDDRGIRFTNHQDVIKYFV